MTSDDTRDERLDRALASLAVDPPNTVRSERIRARCHEVLARRRRRANALDVAVARLSQPLLEPIFVSILAALFLREAVARTLELFGR